MKAFPFFQKAQAPLLTGLLLLTFLTTPAQKPEIYVSTGHSGAVASVAISPDGKTLASGSFDNTIKLWDFASGQELNTLKGHSGQIRSVAFSPDGKTIASGSLDSTVKLWDVGTGRESKTLQGVSLVNSVAFSPNGKTLAGGGMTIKLWDIASGRELKTFGDYVRSVAFSPDGNTLATDSQLVINFWDVMTGRIVKTLKGHSDAVVAVSFSPDGTRLASGSWDNTIKVWDVISGQELKTLKAHSRQVFGVAFAPDGKTLASGSLDRTIKVWDLVSGIELNTFVGHSGGVFSVAFSHDGKILSSASTDNSVKLWELGSGQEIKTLSAHSSFVSSVALSIDGNLLASGSEDKTIKLWDLVFGQQLKSLKGHTRGIRSVAFSRDGKTLASGSGDNTIKLWDVASGQELRTLNGHSHDIMSVTFSPEAKTVASASYDGTIKLWDVASGAELKTLIGHLSPVHSVSFSPDGKTLASGSLDYKVEFKPDGTRTINMKSLDKAIKLWDVPSGQQLKTLKGHSEGVNSVSFSPNGSMLASGGGDGTVKLWNVDTGQEVSTLETRSSSVSSVGFRPDGKTLVSGSIDQAIRLWDIASRKELKSPKGHSDRVTSVVFSSDGKTLASGSGDGTTRLWDVNTGINLASLIALDENDWVVVTPDGRFDGSVEGMKLISYRQGDKLLPLESFFEEFFTPGLLQEVYSRRSAKGTGVVGKIGGIRKLGKLTVPVRAPMAKVDFSKAVRLPPVVRISSPTVVGDSGAETARVVVEADDQGGGVEDIRLYQNGKLLDEGTRELIRERKGNSRTFEVALLPGENTFRATAFNSDRTEAVPYEIKIERKAPEASANLYILAVGLNEYKNTKYNLNYGRADAQAFADAVEQRGKRIFKEIKKTVVFDADASQSGIKAAFETIMRQARPQDVFVFFYAGHGAMSQSDPKTPADFYLVPYEVVNMFADEGLAGKGIGARELRELLKKIEAQKQLIVIDACESGGAVETIAMRGPAEEKAIMQLARSTGVAVLASSGQNQVATEFGKLGHGVFTYALLAGINGAADSADGDGKITIAELVAYINDHVPELTQIHRGRRQDPNSSTRGQDFPIAIK